MVERVADALVFTEKASLVRLDFTQVKGGQWETSCGKVERQLERIEIIIKVSLGRWDSWSDQAEVTFPRSAILST